MLPTFRTVMLLALMALIPALTHAVPPGDHLPKIITRTLVEGDNRRLTRTVVQFDKNTTAKDVIQACNFLAAEGVTLRFSTLKIGRSLAGIAGKKRIMVANGALLLPNGKSQQFSAGGLLGFRYLSLQYVTDTEGRFAQIEMVSSVD